MQQEFFQENKGPLERALEIEKEIVPLRARDRALMEDVAETLASHVLLRSLRLRFVVRGGVVHLRGKVPSPDVRRLVRRVVARTRGIHAVWDTLLLPAQTTVRIIDLGCGNHKQLPWATGVDQYPFEGVDVVADIEAGLPFKDDEIDHVYAIHFLEHVRDLVALMNEIHRCLKPGGVLHAMVPNCESVHANADPTHVRFFNPQTFKYFCISKPGVRSYRPLIVSGDHDNILADLEPVKDNQSVPTGEELARHFE